MLVKELLQLLIDIVDTDLFKSIVVKDLKTSNIQDTNVGHLLHGRITKGCVTLLNNKSERTLIDGTSNTSNRAGSILTG